jgi:glucosamine-6-phosphate deaminase
MPSASVVVATGDTPMGMYGELAFAVHRGELDCSRLRVFQLDEYVGVDVDDPRSLYGWMNRAFLQPLRIPEARVVRLPGDTRDWFEACSEYDRTVAEAGGLDFAILGIGPNGHLGFNEPPSGADSTTRMVALTSESVESNARYWGGREKVPKRALTAGMAVLLVTRKILVVVSGEHKQEILQWALEGSVTPDVPASYLQQASDVTVVADAWAAAQLDSKPLLFERRTILHGCGLSGRRWQHQDDRPGGAYRRENRRSRARRVQ